MPPVSSLAPLALVATFLGATAAGATSRGMPLSPSLTVRGPVSHTIAGASLTTPGGAVLSSATAHVDVPAGSVAVLARLVWLGSRAGADESVVLTTPDGARGDVLADACDEIDAGAQSPLPYFRCHADVTARFATKLAGTITVAGLDVSTGAPWSYAQGFAGAFALVMVFADPADTAPRLVQIADGLVWSQNQRVATGVLPAFTAASVDGVAQGRVSYVAIEGDADMPGDGECSGDLDDPSCDFAGLCLTAGCDVLFTLADEHNAPGNALNESSGDALDIDTFSIDGLLAVGVHDDLRAYVQTGGDAALLALAVVEVREADSDADGLSDADELARGTDASDADSDDDGIFDGVEVFGRTPADPRAQPTDPLDPDSDADGLADGAEDANASGTREDDETSAVDADSDDDMLTDGVERGSRYPGGACRTGGSDPLDADSDGVGALDGAEDADHDGALSDGETTPCFFNLAEDLPHDPYAPVVVDEDADGDDAIDAIDPRTPLTATPVDERVHTIRASEPNDGIAHVRGEMAEPSASCAQSSPASFTWFAFSAVALLALRRRSRA